MSGPELDDDFDWQEGARQFLLKRTPLGFFYKHFFKPFFLTRSLVIWTWKRAFPVWVSIYRRFSTHVYKLPLRSVSAAGGGVRVIAEAEAVVTPSPEVFPRRVSLRCPSPHQSYTFPAIYITQLTDCLVRGSSNLIVAREHLIHHDLFRPDYDYTSEEIHGRLVLKPKRRVGYVFLRRNISEYIDEAAVFTDALSPNYAHFMTEVLPRLAMYIKYVPGDIPLLVDAGLHRNMMAAIQSVVGKRELILIGKGRAVRVGKVHSISNCGYVPFERRAGSERLPGHSQGQFSPAALRAVREAVLGSLNMEVRNGRRLYIRRNSGYRNVLNAQEIEDVLVARGFEVVEPEKLSFSEQVEVFSSADVVVGATGAAFANLLFCKPGTLLIIMIADLESTSYYYWQNMACASNNSVVYVFGVIQRNLAKSIHSDFHVVPSDVIDALGNRFAVNASVSSAQ